MEALCLNTSLETLRPLCCCRTHHPQWDLCHCLHEGTLQALQAVVTRPAMSSKTAHSL